MSAASDDYAQYRCEIESQELPAATRTGALAFVAVNVAFIGVDWVTFPEQFWDFLPIRVLSCCALSLPAYLAAKQPLASAAAVATIGASMLLFLIANTGGGESSYYVGLVLLLEGIGVFLPLSVRQASSLVGLCFAGFIGVALLEGSGISPLSTFFLAGAAVASLLSCAGLDRIRFRQFLQRRELRDARDHLAELDVAKARFTANIHHELRTPLTLMLAPVDSMAGGDLGPVPDTFSRPLRIVQSNGLRLLKLINNLLDLAKVESNQLTIQRRPITPGQVIQEIVDGAHGLASRKSVVITTNGLDRLPTTNADSEALEKIITNLIGNALKFTENGRIEITGCLASPELELGHNAIHLAVRDTGIGIPTDQLAKIFDRFAQVDGSATRKFEGTGIGLSLVKELTVLHGGKVWAESEGAGNGSTFHIALPHGTPDSLPDGDQLLRDSTVDSVGVSRAFEALITEVGDTHLPLGSAQRGTAEEYRRSVKKWAVETGSAEAPVSESDHPTGTPEVVIAEDNSDMLELLTFLVSKEFVVRPTRNGREALESARANPPSLILTDVMMPEMSGIELCRAIKNDPELSSIPVMIVTSKAEDDMKIQGLELGADDYLTKPFHPRELVARVRSLVRLRCLQTEVESQNLSLAAANDALGSALTDLKDAEVQLVESERLAAIGELSAGVAHEVNNPINFAKNALHAIRTRTLDFQKLSAELAALRTFEGSAPRDLMGEVSKIQRDLDIDNVSDEIDELVEIATDGLQRTSRLVSDLRDFAAPGNKVVCPVDINHAIASTVRLMKPTLATQGCEIRLDLSPALLPVTGDPAALNQVLLNLMKNAADAVNDMAGVVQITSIQTSDNVLITVHDNGPGIDPENEQRAFEPFFTTKAPGHGTGLGLAMSRRIARAFGGELTLESSELGGVAARLLIPCLSEDGIPAEPASNAADQTPRGVGH